MSGRLNIVKSSVRLLRSGALCALIKSVAARYRLALFPRYLFSFLMLMIYVYSDDFLFPGITCTTVSLTVTLQPEQSLC